MKEIENFISDKESKYFINFHNKYYNLENNYSVKHRQTEVIQCDVLLKNAKFKKMNDTLNKFIQKINKKYVVNYFQIVKWPTYESQGEHFDFDIHPYTSVLYLKDNFEGGETIVGNKIVKPKKCKLIGFNGNKTKHEVDTITKGVRYTIPCWYKLRI